MKRSGEEVPTATTVEPRIKGDIFNFFPSSKAPRRKISPESKTTASKTMMTKNKNILKKTIRRIKTIFQKKQAVFIGSEIY